MMTSHKPLISSSWIRIFTSSSSAIHQPRQASHLVRGPPNVISSPRTHRQQQPTATRNIPKMTTSQPRPAPWRKEFKAHIESLPMPTFVLATSDTSSDHHPRARTCVYRGLWASLPPNERNPAPRNPDIFESDMPTFTTDARMEKARELCSLSSEGKDVDDIPFTGGGGVVEAVYWIPEYGTQWRIRGSAYLLGPDIDDPASDSSREVKKTIQAQMCRRDGSDSESTELYFKEKEEEWSFSREVTAHFGNLSPAMRGTFRHPPPGRSVARNPLPEDGHLGLGKKVDDVEDPVARRNFRVVVIMPHEVDRTDLSDPENPRRWIYTYQAGFREEWEVVEVWP